MQDSSGSSEVPATSRHSCLGLAYLWFFLIGQRPTTPAAAAADPKVLELIGALALLGAVAWGWIFGVERRVLAFSPAEVTFLFSGPVSRQGLIQFKLLRNQLLILFNALLWTLILSRERFGVSPWLRVISIWVMLTTLSFHRLGASFVRTSLSEHGRLGARHRTVSLALLERSSSPWSGGLRMLCPSSRPRGSRRGLAFSVQWPPHSIIRFRVS